MKRIIALALSGLLMAGALVGCGSTKQESVNEETRVEENVKGSEEASQSGRKMNFKEVGLEFNLPAVFDNYQNNIDAIVLGGDEFEQFKMEFGYVTDESMDELMKLSSELEKKGEPGEEEMMVLMEKYQDAIHPVGNISVYANEVGGEDRIKEMNPDYDTFELVKQDNGLDYYLVYNSKYDETGLSDGQKDVYSTITSSFTTIKDSIRTSKPVSEVEEIMNSGKIEFESKNLKGEKVDSSIFKDSKLTMVNIWATFCGPCISEMPDLQELYEDIKDEDLNLIGIVSDTPDADNEELARKILDKKGAKFMNIIPDDKLQNGILKSVAGVPTTVFVDSEGNMVGEPIVGSRSAEEYKEEIMKRLK